MSDLMARYHHISINHSHPPLLNLLSKKVHPTPLILLLHIPTRIIIPPKRPQERRLHITPIMAPHNLLNRLTSFVGMVERDSGSVVVQNVVLDHAVEERSSDEAEVAVDGRGGAPHEGPGCVGVVGERKVSVLEEGYCY